MKQVMTTPTHSGRDITPKSRFEAFCRRVLPHKEIGWQEIGEVFYRYTLVKTPWFSLYLHQLDAPNWHPVGCHDHPWWFITLLLKGGYLEYNGKKVWHQKPGQVMYRPANWSHDITTPYGRSWSLVLTGKKQRAWGFQPCGEED